MGAFWQGLLLGFSAAVPLGPINIMIMTAAINSFWLAFAIGLGAMSADVLYLALLAFGALSYLQGEIISKIIGIFGICYLLYISYLIFKNADKVVVANQEIKTNKSSFIKNYLKGFFATLTNPYTVGFWLSVASYAQRFDNQGLVVAGLVLAIFIWITFMPFGVHKSSKFISQNVAKIMSYICALILAGFAFSLFYKLFLQ